MIDRAPGHIDILVFFPFFLSDVLGLKGVFWMAITNGERPFWRARSRRDKARVWLGIPDSIGFFSRSDCPRCAHFFYDLRAKICHIYGWFLERFRRRVWQVKDFLWTGFLCRCARFGAPRDGFLYFGVKRSARKLNPKRHVCMKFRMGILRWYFRNVWKRKTFVN